MIFTIFVILGLTRGLFIKHTLEDKFMKLINEPRTFIKLSPDINDAVEVEFTKFKDGLVFIRNSNDTSKVFDVAGTGRLNLFRFHGAANQQFRISMVDTDKYNIINREKCLEYDSTIGDILLKPCTNLDSQIFEIIDKNKLPMNPDPIGLNYDKYGIQNNEDEPVYDLPREQTHSKRHHHHHSKHKHQYY